MSADVVKDVEERNRAMQEGIRVLHNWDPVRGEVEASLGCYCDTHVAQACVAVASVFDLLQALS